MAKLEAIDHPLRLAILTSLALKPASVKELAEALKAPVGKVRYQLDRLRKASLTELKEERRRRGVSEQIYFARPEPLSEVEVSHLSGPQREKVIAGLLRALLADTLAAQRAGAFTRRDDFLVARMPIPIDEKGWVDLVRIHREALAKLSEVREESRARIEKEGGRTSDAFSFLLLFEVPPSAQAAG